MEYEPKIAWIQTRAFRRKLLVAFAVLSAVLVASFLIYKSFSFSKTAQTIDLLDRAYKNGRPFETRISDFSFAPYANLRGEPDAKTNLTERDRAERILLDAVDAENPSADELHSLGRLYLVKREFDKAIAALRRASELAEDKAKIRNDLGVALMEKGKSADASKDDSKSLEYFAQSFDELAKAAESKEKLPEVFFNQALCLQLLNLPIQAGKVWQEFLRLDGDSEWTQEARKNLELVESKMARNLSADEILQNFLNAYSNGENEKAYEIVSRNREMITGKLIPQRLIFLFLETEKPERQKYLSALQFIAKMEAEKTGDGFFSEIAAFYTALPEEKFKALREAQTAVKNGYELCKKTEYKAALEEFAWAREIFAGNGNVWEAALVDYWIAYCDFNINNLKKCGERLEKLIEFGSAKNYKWLLSLAFHWQSVNAKYLKEISKSFLYAESALKFADETFDLYNAQKIYSWLADCEIQMKQYERAYINVERVLNLGNYPESSARQKLRDYDMTARFFYGIKLYRTAVVFDLEAININALQTKDATFDRTYQANLSRIYGEMKNFEEALKAADASRAAAERISDEQNRKKGIAFAHLQKANLLLDKGDHEKSLENFALAAELYDSTEIKLYQYEAAKGRLLCHLAKNDDEAVERELPEVLRLFEDNRGKILEEQNRNSFFNDEQSVYDLASGYAFDRGRFETAFNYSENSRSRSLLDWQKSGGRIVFEKDEPKAVYNEVSAAKPLTLAEIRAQMPGSTQIVQYSVLRDRVLIWLVTPEKTETFSTEINSDELKEKVSAFLEAVKNRETEKQNQLSRELYQTLFSPLEASLDGAKEICLIPDKILFHLPFNALVFGKADDYLFTRYKIFYAPSANTFLVSSESARAKNPGADEKILSIGNPAFDQKEFPDLQLLPVAEKEAKEIAGLYPKSTFLSGKAATKNSLKSNIPQAEVVHFAGHYVTNELSSLLSSFLVAGTGSETRLANYELLQEKVEKPRLIVLSACETGVERYYEGEGMIGAGRTFLALGVPVVVASQWKVDSDATAELMMRFHRYRKAEKITTVAALQRAQLDMLKSSNPNWRQPFYWAGFLMLGGHAEF